jgi:hypothetical protein
MTASDITPGPAGAGAAAGRTLLESLAVCESISLQAIDDPELRSGVVLEARRLLGRATEALDRSVRAYARATEELDAATHAHAAGSGRDATLRAALIDAADSLLALVDIAADTALLSAGLADVVEASRRVDAAGTVELALGAARCLRHLLEVNLALPRRDERRDVANGLVAVAEQAAASARRALEEG